MVAIIAFLSISGLCLQAVNNQVQVQPCDSSQSGQLWELESIGDGTFKITNNLDGKALDVTRGGLGNCIIGAEIITFDYYGTINQKWYYNADGRLTPACNTTIVLDTQAQGIGSGAAIVLNEKLSDPAPTQTFQIQIL
ncbi:galactose-binding lectin protein [Rhyzopertha dominica]|nr:galactose-binding lectin protein [Rhyzopertha dominica]